MRGNWRGYLEQRAGRTRHQPYLAPGTTRCRTVRLLDLQAECSDYSGCIKAQRLVVVVDGCIDDACFGSRIARCLNIGGSGRGGGATGFEAIGSRRLKSKLLNEDV